MSIKLSKYSETRLIGVKEPLVRVVYRAAELSTNVDWRVNEGLRTVKRQRELVAKGASQTMHSYHLEGRAVDLVAMIGGSVSWHWPLYYEIAAVMREAAITEKVIVYWGGVWDAPLNSLSPRMADEARAYCVRHKGKDFMDGPHFQIPR